MLDPASYMRLLFVYNAPNPKQFSIALVNFSLKISRLEYCGNSNRP